MAIPPHMLNEMNQRGEQDLAAVAADTLAEDTRHRRSRARATEHPAAKSTPSPIAGCLRWLASKTEQKQPKKTEPSLQRRIYTGQSNRDSGDDQLLRSEGDPAADDSLVNLAYRDLGTAFRYLTRVHGRNSHDGKGAAQRGVVHYRRNWMNAAWNGSELLFGDGGQALFHPFPEARSVTYHEYGHAIAGSMVGLRYQGQSGALAEHLADAVAAAVMQWEDKTTPADASWLIGQDLLTKEVSGMGIRDMMNPGTAYNDDRLGEDPQPAHMDNYINTDRDNGGVHLNSGVPNRMFALAAVSIGQPVWETLMPIWFAALASGELGRDATFAQFTHVAIEHAEKYSPHIEEAAGKVGVL